MKQPVDWRAGLYRWRRWLIAGAIIVIIRALLPLVLQRVIASQASTALNARVEVGDVDLALLSGGVALEDVAVHAIDAPRDSAPLIGWKLFSVDLRWLPLFSKRLQLEEIVLEMPQVSLERLKDGALNLLALVPMSGGEPAPPSAPVDSAQPGWAFGADRIGLRAGNLRFRDLLLEDSEPVDVALPAIEITNVAIQPGVYGQPARALIELKVDDGSLKIDASATMREDGIGIETQIKAEQLPLRRSRLYIPKVGWSDLRGTLAMELVHRIDTNGSRHDLRGTVGLHDLTVRVAGFDGVALAWRRLSVQVDPVDLIEQRVTVAQVDLDGLALPMRTSGDEPLPLLRALLAKPAAASPDAATAEPPPPAATTTPAAATPPSAPAKPWHWSLAAAHITDSKLLVLHDTGQMDVGVGAEVHALADEGDHPATVALGLAIGDGSLHVDGQLRLAPIGFAGHVVIDKLNVPDVVTASSAVAPEVVQAARLALDLNVDAGSLASTPGDLNVFGTIALTDAQIAPPEPKGLAVGLESLKVTLDQLQLAGFLATAPVANQGDLRVRGKVTITEPRVTAPGAKDPTVSAKAIELALSEARAPALLAKGTTEGQVATPGDILVRGTFNVTEPRIAAANPKEFAVGMKSIDVALDEVLVPNPKDTKPGPIRVRVGNVRIAAPTVQVTRTTDGIVLPQLTTASTSGAPAEESAAPEPTPVPSPAAAAPPAPPSIELTLASFELSKGRIAFTDRAVKPFYSGLISPLDIALKGVSFPNPAVKSVRIDATIAPNGKVSADGSISPAGSALTLKVDDVALTAFNPYVTTYSSYGIADGSLTVDTKASVVPNGYKADSSILLHNLDVSGAEGDSLFEQNFGVSLTVALALLKDMSGDITVDVPVESDQDGMKIGIGSIVAGALRSALVGALVSPLKLVGMALPGGKGDPAVPPQIAFRNGRADPAPEGEEQIKQLATFVASRPGMGVTLEPVPSTRDLRWLREHALLEEIGKPQGILGAVKNIGQGGKRERIGKAIAAREADEAGALNDEDAQTLEQWLDERPAPTADQLHALAAARMARIESMLRDDYGVDAARITHRDATADATDVPPTVRMQIGAATK